MSLRRWVLIGLLCWLPIPSLAQVVECIDANGNKSYMQTCPAGTARQREITVPPPVQRTTPAERAKESAEIKSEEKAYEQRRQERLKEAAAEEKKEKDMAQTRQACVEAKRRLEVLSSGRAAARVDPDSGQHVAMDDDARLAEINSLQAKIQAWGSACQ